MFVLLLLLLQFSCFCYLGVGCSHQKGGVFVLVEVFERYWRRDSANMSVCVVVFIFFGLASSV